MIEEIILAFVQAATEFLPVSSSGHLAILSNLFSEPNLFFITMLHIASLTAVLIFTRKEIFSLLKFDKEARKLLKYLIIATIPATFFGYFFNNFIESIFSSFLYIGIAFLFTGLVLYLTKNLKEYSKLNLKNSFVIGLFQVLALFPGMSRSGMTISGGIFMGLNKERAAKFSLLLLIPLAIGAFILEFKDAYFSIDLVIAFFVTLFFSLLFLNLLIKIIIKEKFWMFSIYCFIIGLISLYLHFFV